MPTLEERVAAAREKLKTLEERQKRADARKKSLESKQTRKADTRRKILVGAIVLARVDQGRIEEAVLRGWMDEALTRADDRELFGLAVLPARPTQAHSPGDRP